MKVASPVGEFPYTLERLRVVGRSVVIEGHMGAWPSRIELEARDVPALLRVLRLPLLLLAAFGALRALRRG